MAKLKKMTLELLARMPYRHEPDIYTNSGDASLASAAETALEAVREDRHDVETQKDRQDSDHER